MRLMMRALFMFAGVLAAGLLACPGVFPASITYDAAKDCILVSGYPEESPANLGMVLEADRKNGWGKVSYDQASDTYTIAASLWIGTDKDLGTFFQIGSKEHPKETLVVRGNLWIRPPRKSPRRRVDGRYMVVNRLTMGDPDDPTIQPVVKIDCSEPNQFGVFLGLREGRAPESGGDLHIYHSTLTAAIQDKDHTWKGHSFSFPGYQGGWYAHSVRLVNSTISWWGGSLYGVPASLPQYGTVIEGVTFENGDAAISHNLYNFKNCVFRNLAAGAATLLSGTFTNCRFENNGSNFSFHSGHTELTLIDCQVGPQKNPVIVPKTKLDAETLWKKGLPPRPGIVELKSLQFQVTDPKGTPIFGASVWVICPDDESAVRRELSVTNEAGLTSGDVEKGAILITTGKLLPTEEPAQPEMMLFSYQIQVQAPGYQSREIVIARGEQTFDRPIKVVLKKG